MKTAEMAKKRLERKIKSAQAELELIKDDMAKVLEKNLPYEIATWIPSYSKKYAEVYESIQKYTEMLDMIDEIMEDENEMKEYINNELCVEYSKDLRNEPNHYGYLFMIANDMGLTERQEEQDV